MSRCYILIAGVGVNFPVWPFPLFFLNFLLKFFLFFFFFFLLYLLLFGFPDLCLLVFPFLVGCLAWFSCVSPSNFSNCWGYGFNSYFWVLGFLICVLCFPFLAGVLAWCYSLCFVVNFAIIIIFSILSWFLFWLVVFEKLYCLPNYCWSVRFFCVRFFAIAFWLGFSCVSQ